MTLDELKLIADSMGYRILKKSESLPKLIPCICGCNRRTTVRSTSGEFYICKNCGIYSEPAITERQKRKNWNKLIERSSNEADI